MQARADAKLSGERFYDGRPCPTCSGTQRYVSNAACSHCLPDKRVRRTREEELKQSRGWKAKNPGRYLLNNARKRSREKGFDFDLTLDDVLIPSHCPVFGIPLDPAGEPRSPNLPSIDRLDNDRGYVKGNVQVISWAANFVKGHVTLDQAKKIVAYLERNLASNDDSTSEELARAA